MTVAILALVLAPSFLVFLVGCMLVLTRSLRAQVAVPVRIKQGGRPV